MNRVLALISGLIMLIGMLGTPQPTAAAEGDWYAEYFANTTLSGGPVLTRYEADLTHTWGFGSPGAGVPADNFSARYVKDVWFEAGTYRARRRAAGAHRVLRAQRRSLAAGGLGEAPWRRHLGGELLG